MLTAAGILPAPSSSPARFRAGRVAHLSGRDAPVPMGTHPAGTAWFALLWLAVRAPTEGIPQ